MTPSPAAVTGNGAATPIATPRKSAPDKARAKKNAYNTKYHASAKRKAYRAKLNAANRASPNAKGQDKSHTRGGRLTNERRSSNRARQGAGGRSTKR